MPPPIRQVAFVGVCGVSIAGIVALSCWTVFWPWWRVRKATIALREADDMPGILSAIKTLQDFRALDLAVPCLREKARSEDAVARLYAVGALASIGPEASDAVPELISSLRDENVHYIPNESYKRSDQGEAVLPGNISIDVRAHIHYYAVKALASIGRNAQDAIPVLREEMRETKSPEMREAIRDAIQRIGAENE